MELIEKISIDMLNTSSVSILKQQFVVVNGVSQQVENNWRRAYENSVSGRESLSTEVPEPYLSAIMAVWGDTPTVDNSIIQDG